MWQIITGVFVAVTGLCACYGSLCLLRVFVAVFIIYKVYVPLFIHALRGSFIQENFFVNVKVHVQCKYIHVHVHDRVISLVI